MTKLSSTPNILNKNFKLKQKAYTILAPSLNLSQSKEAKV